MNRKKQCYSFFFFLAMFHYAEGEPLCTRPVAKVVSVQGKAHRQHRDHSEWQKVRTDDSFCAGGTLRNEKWSRATLILTNNEKSPGRVGGFLIID